jgi:septum formation protein
VTGPRRRESTFYHGARPLVLASASPRRVALLRQVGATFAVADPGPDRPWPGRAEPRHGVRALALHKARAVAQRRPDALVLGADTVVVLAGDVLGKPGDAREAAELLRRLAGRWHEVWTGVALVAGREARTAAECTRVRFARLDRDDIERYVATGEPLDKAGAYAIQGRGGALVRAVEGCYFNVVGLPLARVRLLLREFEP